MAEPQQPTPPEPQPAPAAPPAPQSRKSLPKTTLVLAGVLVLALGFVGGVGVSRATAAGDQPPAAAGQGGGPRGAYQTKAPDDATVGTVERVEGDTVYVRTPDGETVEVTTDDETEVRVSKEGTVDDLDEGSSVVVRGEKSGDSVTAKNIDAGGTRPTRIGPSEKP